MPQLRLSLLGPFQLTLDQAPILGLTSAKIRALLAFLAVEAGRPHSREVLAEFLWPDRPPGTALQNLRQSLTRLQKAIPDPAGAPPFLLVTRQTIQFNPEGDLRLDVAEFNQALTFSQHHPHKRVERCRRCAARLATAVTLYRGDFLHNVLANAPDFDEWALVKREWLRREALGALHSLAEHRLWLGEYSDAYQAAWRQVELDPWREEAHQQVMRALVEMGRPGEALAQYASLRRILEKDLKAAPARETTELYEQTRSGAPRRSSVSTLHNMPLQASPFVGREEELTQIAERLDDPNCHLLTLVGPGGVGKTRLAVQTALEQADAYQDGAAFVPLAAVPASDRILTALMDALKIPIPVHTQSDEARKAHALRILGRREMLLVLDNFEHLGPGPTWLTEIAERAPRVKLLITSRQPLHLRAEWILDIDGLTYPSLPEMSEANVERYDAVRFFLQCAGRIKADYSLAPHTLSDAARICKLVSGAPLAIELAAAWARTVPLENIASEIARDLDFLATSMPDVPERHQSTRASFEHSWRLLDAAEQHILRRLSVFRGGFSEEAVEKVCGAGPDLFGSLVEKSLVKQVAWENGHTRARYDLHDLVRQFAAEKLEADPADKETLHTRHCRHYADYLTDEEEALYGSRQAETLSALSLEIGNLSAAWDWAAAHLLTDPIERCLAAFTRLCEVRGWVQECETALDRAATMLIDRGARADPVETEEYGVVPLSILLGRIWAQQGSFAALLSLPNDKGRELLGKSLTLLRHFEQREDIAPVLLSLARIDRQAGDFRMTRERLLESLAIAREIENRRHMANALGELAFTEYLQDQDAAGKAYGEEGLAIYRRLGDPGGEAKMLSALGLIATHQSDYETANQCFQDSLKILEAQKDPLRLSGVLNNLGLLAYTTGAYDEAERHFQRAGQVFQDIGEQYGVALTLYNRGRVTHKRGNYAKAKLLHQEGLVIRQEMGSAYLCGVSSLHLGRACLALGEEQEAEHRFRQALTLTRGSGNVHVRLQILVSLAQVLAAKGEIDKALVLTLFSLHHPPSAKETDDFPAIDDARRLLTSLAKSSSDEAVEATRRTTESMTLDEITELFQARS